MDLTKMCSIGVVCLGLLSSCEKMFDTDPDPPEKDPAEEAYPINRLITDKQGRNIDVLINGKSPNSIRFIRKSDGKEFQYLISELSPKDKAFVGTLPQNLLSKLRIERPTPAYVVSREKELEELGREQIRLQRQRRTAAESGSKIDKRTANAALRAVATKIEKLRVQIEDYQLQHPED